MVSGAIVDLDGTVYRGDELVPGAADGIESLRSAGVSLCFFSNNPTMDGADYVEYLREFGLDVRDGEACSAGVATVEYLREHHADDAVMLVGSDGLTDQIADAGLALTDDPEETDVLVASWDPEFDYDDMTAALRAVDDDTAFVGTDPDRTFPQENGHLIPGSGAVVRSVAATVGREPDTYVGKPSEIALELALERVGCPAEECLVVGDRPGTDIAMGSQAGMTTVLVLSGVSDREDVGDSDVDPDFVVDSIGDIDEVLAAAR